MKSIGNIDFYESDIGDSIEWPYFLSYCIVQYAERSPGSVLGSVIWSEGRDFVLSKDKMLLMIKELSVVGLENEENGKVISLVLRLVGKLSQLVEEDKSLHVFFD